MLDIFRAANKLGHLGVFRVPVRLPQSGPVSRAMGRGRRACVYSAATYVHQTQKGAERGNRESLVAFEPLLVLTLWRLFLLVGSSASVARHSCWFSVAL